MKKSVFLLVITGLFRFSYRVTDGFPGFVDVDHEAFMQCPGRGDADTQDTGSAITDVRQDGAYLGRADINRSYNIPFFHLPSLKTVVLRPISTGSLHIRTSSLSIYSSGGQQDRPDVL